MDIKIKNEGLYLITRGSGFLGQSLIERIHSFGGKVRVLARNEGNLIKLKEKYPSIEIYPGDITDLFELKQAAKGITGIFHLAAFKHVGLAQTFSKECIKSNVVGSMNVLDLTLEDPNIEFVIGISTDKACKVAGVYGASKYLMEALFLQYEGLNPGCQYRLVRYGNVLYSTGSVLCKWKDLIEQDKQCIVTDPEATRFYWTVDQAIDLIFECLEKSTTSKPFCPTMKSVKIEDLLEAMYLKYGNGKRIEPKLIGLQKGENLHEKILEDGLASDEVEKYSIEELLQLI